MGSTMVKPLVKNGNLLDVLPTQGVPVLILANKQDLPNACGAKELERLLGLNELSTTVPKKTMTSSSSSSSNLIGCSVSNQRNIQTPLSTEKNLQFSTPMVNIAPVLAQNIEGNSSINEVSCTPIIYSDSTRLDPYIQNDSNKRFCNQKYTAAFDNFQSKGWYIQPTCAITGEGLQEGLDALYDMILKRRKITKSYKKKRFGSLFRQLSYRNEGIADNFRTVD
nr:uncharacterized protein LOC108131567 isoform X5 [Drosophila bipectinata]